jgi:hypothetical protein
MLNTTARSGDQAVVAAYAHGDYAGSLAEFGAPRQLPRSGGWVLEQATPGLPYKDARGCYPLFSCPRWDEVLADIEELRSEWVSLAIVTDPFGDYDETYLRRCFPDMVTPFKQHYVADLSRPIESFVSAHHRRYAIKALRETSISKCEDPTTLLTDWVMMYSVLIDRHAINGIARFSETSFSLQLRVPGLTAFQAFHETTRIGIVLWYTQGPVAYYHLGASSPLGYQMRVSFGLFWFSIQYFAERGLKWINLGAGAGVTNTDSGLTAFKKGWSTGARPAYFCGRVFDWDNYESLLTANLCWSNGYFPAYRSTE